jgi:hypothetical protein
VEGDAAGLIVFGYSCAALSVRRHSGELVLTLAEGDASGERQVWRTGLAAAAAEAVYLRVMLVQL